MDNTLLLVSSQFQPTKMHNKGLRQAVAKEACLVFFETSSVARGLSFHLQGDRCRLGDLAFLKQQTPQRHGETMGNLQRNNLVTRPGTISEKGSWSALGRGSAPLNPISICILMPQFTEFLLIRNFGLSNSNHLDSKETHGNKEFVTINVFHHLSPMVINSQLHWRSAPICSA